MLTRRNLNPFYRNAFLILRRVGPLETSRKPARQFASLINFNFDLFRLPLSVSEQVMERTRLPLILMF